MKKTAGEWIFEGINGLLLILLACATAYPILYVLGASFSSPESIYRGEVWLLPKGFSTEAYKNVLTDPSIWSSYGNSIFYTVVGTALSVVLTVSGAYPISKKRFQGRVFFTFLFALTMWFNAGLIPAYLNIQELGLYNTRLSVLLVGACSAFYIILVRTNFQAIPDSLEEAATIDGANDLTILMRIYLPLSKPAIATITLFYAVSRWNGYLWPMILLKDLDKMPLQVLLKKLVVESGAGGELAAVMDITSPISQETMVYATIIVATIPMLLVYPFIQKYFEKGMMIGSVKG